MSAGDVGNLFAAGHPSNFFDALSEVEWLDVGRSVIGLDRLGNTVVLLPLASNLGQVRDAKYLMRTGNMAQLFANDFGCFPTDTSVHFVKNQRRYLVLARQNAFHGQHDTRQFTARGNASDGFGGLARIGGEE